MAEQATFVVPSGGTVTAFEMGQMQEQYYPGAVEPMADWTDYNFINGRVDVGDLPCRKAVWDDIKTRTVDLEPFEPVALNLPGFSRRLDFSDFWHRPTRLARWIRTTLTPPTDGSQPFRLATCGGVQIWVDGKKSAVFEPYTRNSLQESTIDLPLRAAGSDVVLLCEDMAERDTNFIVELTWLGEGELTSAVPGSANPDDIAALMDLARSVRPGKVVFTDADHVELVFGDPVARDVQVAAHVGRSSHLTHLPPLLDLTANIGAGSDRVDFGSARDVPDGYHPLALEFSIGETRVERHIAFAVSRGLTPKRRAPNLADRKAEALEYAATHGEPRAGRLLAMLSRGHAFDADARAILQDTLTSINQRKDCADFVLVPLLWLYGAFADDLPEPDRRAAKSAILNFRYWTDEPGNDAMWFWSENHVLCFHASQYIAGLLFPDDVFPNSGLKGRDHFDLAVKRLGHWFDSIEQHGLAEWNSAAYYPIDFIGLFGLYHWGRGDIRDRAKALLDRVFQMVALHTIGAVPAGSMGRAYDKELRAGPLTELAPFVTVAFGEGWLNKGVAALPMFCASDYVPPQQLNGLVNPTDGQVVQAHYVQGYGQTGRLALHKTAHVQMSACVDGVPGATGHQQHLVDVQFAAAPFARLWVNHPGEDDPWVPARPSYWAGNGVMPRVAMHQNTSLFLSSLPHDAPLKFTHVYAPLSEFDDHILGPDWMVLRSGRGVAIVTSASLITPIRSGPGAGLEFRCDGAITAWAVQVADLGDRTLSDWASTAKTHRLDLAAESLRATLVRPNAPTLDLDYEKGLFVENVGLAFPTSSYDPQILVRTANAG